MRKTFICILLGGLVVGVAQEGFSETDVAEKIPQTNAAQSPSEVSLLAPATEVAFSDPHLRPADVLSITVYNEEDLTKDVEINKNGFINYPLIGRVKVEGMLKEDAEKKIRDLLEKDYLVNPIISVRLKRSPVPKEPIEDEAVLISYVLLGEVRKPGTYEFDPTKGKMTLLKAISIAGGFSNISNVSKIRMLRHDKSGNIKSFTVNAKDIISGKRPDEGIEEDDLISVPESLF